MENSYLDTSYEDFIKEPICLAVYNTGTYKCGPDFTYAASVRDHYLMYYVKKGKGRLNAGGKIHEISSGSIFIIYPDIISSHTADSENPWEYTWVGFNGNGADKVLELTDLSKASPVIKTFGNKAETLFSNIYASAGNSLLNEMNLTGNLFMLLTYLAESAQKKPQSPQGGSNDYVKLAMQFIDYNYARNISVDDIASYADISRSHLYRIFIKHLGVSPNEYLTRYRINKACTLLMTTKLTIGEISSSVGFYDQLYFSRVFKKLMGVSPSKFN